MRTINSVFLAAFVVGSAGCAGLDINGALLDPCNLTAASTSRTFGAQISRGHAASEHFVHRWAHRPISDKSIRVGLSAFEERVLPESDALTGLELTRKAYTPEPTVVAANAASQAIAKAWSKVSDDAFSLDGTSTRALASIGSDDGRTNFSKVLAANGFEALVVDRYGRLATLLARSNSTKQDEVREVHALLQEYSTSVFLATYFKAYFRGGRVLQVALDTKALADRAADDVKNQLSDVSLSDDQYRRLRDTLEKQLRNTCKENTSDPGRCLLSRAFGDSSFVTRSGMAVQFSGIEISVGTNGELSPAVGHPASTEYGPQLMRVFIEALFDSYGTPVPATAKSTACTSGLYRGDECLNDATDQKFKDRVAKVDANATKAETVVASATAKYIRGISVLSLNNEALAKTVETFAGVAARKIAEKAIWSKLKSKDCEEGAVTAAMWSDE